jgi:hypothetical protein
MSIAGVLVSTIGFFITIFWALEAWLSNDKGVSIIAGGLSLLFIIMALVSVNVIT